jgi:hypothetical protein
MNSVIVGPIGREYCLYFYIMSIVAVVSAALVFIPAVYWGLTHKEGIKYFLMAFANIILFLLAYLQNRLLYNMCGKTL